MRTGRTTLAVHSRRSKLDINRRWTAAQDAVVRAKPAAEAARLTDRTLAAVKTRRRRLELSDTRRSQRYSMPKVPNTARTSRRLPYGA